MQIKCDVTNILEVKVAAELTRKKFGKVDILINCAGDAKNNGVLNMSDDEWKFTIGADLNSVFYVTREIANIVIKNNYGRIINIASMYGLVGNIEMNTVAERWGNKFYKSSSDWIGSI